MKIAQLIACIVIGAAVISLEARRSSSPVKSVESIETSQPTLLGADIRKTCSDAGFVAQADLDALNDKIDALNKGADEVCAIVFAGGLGIKNVVKTDADKRAFADLCCSRAKGTNVSKAHTFLGCATK